MKILLSLLFISNLAFADAPGIPQMPELLPPSSNVDVKSEPVQPDPAPQIKSNSANNVSPPILVLSEDDRNSLSELNSFLKDLDPHIKSQIHDFEEEMKILRANSQQAFDKLSHEAKLALKGKKDKIDKLSEAAKKVYYKNE